MFYGISTSSFTLVADNSYNSQTKRVMEKQEEIMSLSEPPFDKTGLVSSLFIIFSSPCANNICGH